MNWTYVSYSLAASATCSKSSSRPVPMTADTPTTCRGQRDKQSSVSRTAVVHAVYHTINTKQWPSKTLRHRLNPNHNIRGMLSGESMLSFWKSHNFPTSCCSWWTHLDRMVSNKTLPFVRKCNTVLETWAQHTWQAMWGIHATGLLHPFKQVMLMPCSECELEGTHPQVGVELVQNQAHGAGQVADVGRLLVQRLLEWLKVLHPLHRKGVGYDVRLTAEETRGGTESLLSHIRWRNRM